MSARRGTAATHRIPALLLVLAAVAGLVAVSRAGTGFTYSRHAPAELVSGPAVPPANAISSSWYCAEGTSVAGGRTDETVIVASLARRPIVAAITVLAGTGAPPVTRRVRVRAFGQERVDVSTIVATAEPGVVVEVTSGPAVVEHTLRRSGSTAVGPCAREASPDWYFPFGHTNPAGVEDWVALFNPFGDDAIVDFTYLTNGGVQTPDVTRSVVVGRHSRVSIPLHEILRDQDLVAFRIHARIGRVVAEQSIYFPASSGTAGLATALGASGAAPTWRVPTGDAESGATANLAIANFTNVGAQVDVRVVPDQGLPPATTRTSVPSMSVTVVDVGKNVPAGTGYAVTAAATHHQGIVAEFVEVWSAPATVSGVTTTLASTTVANRWAFATGRLDTTGDTQIGALNGSRHAVSVELLATDPTGLRHVVSAQVGAGQRVAFPLAAIGVDPDRVLVVRATGPIVAGRLVLAATGSGSVGLPELG